MFLLPPPQYACWSIFRVGVCLFVQPLFNVLITCSTTPNFYLRFSPHHILNLFIQFTFQWPFINRPTFFFFGMFSHLKIWIYFCNWLFMSLAIPLNDLQDFLSDHSILLIVKTAWTEQLLKTRTHKA